MLIEKFYCVNSMSDHLLIDVFEFIDGPLSILWHNNGLFGLIPAERVRNDLNNLADLKKVNNLQQLSLQYSGEETITYHWDDIVTVKKLF